ncbi:hypothetical protein DH2020_017420 [Rehmannia glutinosa]|uniref:Uncharacterized protein n=1 Tax=Rehmannia glutinosa TaxID=99300 RepID=A0ABR0WV30_REHGL
MGCCLSSTKTSSKPPKTPKNPKPTPKNSSISKSPPPTHPLLEEETVKEVLSETRTIPKPPSSSLTHRVVNQGNRKIESPFIKSAPLLHDKVHRNGVVWKKPLTAFGGDDPSEEVSEICSTLGDSETVSVSTTTVTTEKRENDVELREQLRQRSPARRKNTSFSGEVRRDKIVGRSPGRRSEPSPSRARPGQGPGSGYGRRKDSGESSGRRSRSPVMRTDSGSSKTGLGRTNSVRKTGKSPGRVGSGLGERIRKVDDGKDGGDIKWPPTSNESLENPLVSLECFIFL